MRLSVFQTAAMIALCAGAALSSAQSSQNPSDRLDPVRPHVQLYLEDKVPAIRWFASAALSGAPVVELNIDGLFVRGRLACSWPGGRYDPERWDEMVLGYTDTGATIYSGCMPGAPVRSFWYEECGRHARVFLEMVRHSGSLGVARCGGADCYFDMNTLPGDPRTPDPGFRVTLKGSTGWEWWPSGREQDRVARQHAAELRNDRTLATFIKGAQTCLKSSQVPACFSAFVKSPIYYPESRIGNGVVTPQQFVEAAWKIADPWGDRAWNHLVACFNLALGDSTHLETDGWVCELEKTSDGWRLEQFYPAP